MKPCSFHLKQDNLELEYAHGKAARMIKSQSKEWLNSLGPISLENTWQSREKVCKRMTGISVVSAWLLGVFSKAGPWIY